jgi:hypothetical protein
MIYFALGAAFCLGLVVGIIAGILSVPTDEDR